MSINVGSTHSANSDLGEAVESGIHTVAHSSEASRIVRTAARASSRTAEQLEDTLDLFDAHAFVPGVLSLSSGLDRSTTVYELAEQVRRALVVREESFATE